MKTSFLIWFSPRKDISLVVAILLLLIAKLNPSRRLGHLYVASSKSNTAITATQQDFRNLDVNVNAGSGIASSAIVNTTEHETNAAPACLPMCRDFSGVGEFDIDPKSFEIKRQTDGPDNRECATKIFTPNEAMDSFLDSHVILIGASITYCLAYSVGHFLVGGSMNKTLYRAGDVIDMYFEKMGSDPTGQMLRMKHYGELESVSNASNHVRMSAIHDFIAERLLLPVANDGGLRITFIKGRLADEFAPIARLFQSPTITELYQPKKRMFLFQTNLQYFYCHENNYCGRRDAVAYIDGDEEHMYELLKRHWENFLVESRDICSRAATTCMVSSTDYTAPRYREKIRISNGIIKAAVSNENALTPSNSIILYINHTRFSKQVQTDMRHGHHSPRYGMLKMQTIWNIWQLYGPSLPPTMQHRCANLIVPEFHEDCKGKPDTHYFIPFLQTRCDVVYRENKSLFLLENSLDLEPMSGAILQVSQTRIFGAWHLGVVCVAVVSLSYFLFSRRRPKVVSVVSEPLKVKSRRLDALGPARYLASLHVALTHLSRQGHMPSAYFLGWGFTWVPWFFMLSGFVLTHAYAEKGLINTHAARLAFLFKRLQGIMPLYILGLGCAVFSSLYSVSLSSDDQYMSQYLDAKGLFLQTFLLQSLFPSVVENAMQAHCWFLSCIVVYWYSFPALLRGLNSLSNSAIIGTAFCCMSIGFVVAVFGDWYTGHQSGSTRCGMDVLVIMMKFHPVFYFHIFLLGCCLGKMLSIMRAHAWGLFVVKWGATLGYVGLGATFLIPGLAPPGYKLSCRLGVLSCFHSLILLGLGSGECFISRTLSSPSLAWLGDISYSQYVFQFIVWKLWQVDSKTSWPLCGLFSIVLCGWSCLFVILEKVIQRGKGFLPMWKAWFAVVLVLLTVSKGVSIPWNANNSVDTRVEVTARLPENITDDALPIMLPRSLEHAGGPRCVPINPSLLSVGDEVYVAARCHAVYTTDQCGVNSLSVAPTGNLNRYTDDGFVLVRTTTWFSTIIFGPLHGSPYDMMELSLGEACQKPPRYHSRNNTVTQQIITGAEDPRLFLRKGDHSLFELTNLVLTFNKLASCLNEEGAVCKSQMFMSDGDAFVKPDDIRAGSAYSQISFENISSNQDHKNFALYERHDSGDTKGELLVVTSWMPLQIYSVETGKVVVQDSEPTAPILRMERDGWRGSDEYNRAPIHGGTNGIDWEPHVALFVFHTKMSSATNGDDYENFFVKLNTSDPPTILDIARRPLPVRKQSGIAFVSGLYEHDQMVTMSYGSGDVQSRVMRMSRDIVESFFIKMEEE